MNTTVLFLFCLLLICYAYVYHNREFSATTSAIREVWSGECHLSCRQSQYSVLSGLSGLNCPPETSSKPSSASGAPTTSSCICESCPCSWVEYVFGTFEPVTEVYGQFVELTSEYCYDAVQTFIDIYNYAWAILRGEVTSRRQVQLVSTPKCFSGDASRPCSLNRDIEKEKPILRWSQRARSDGIEPKPSRSLTFDTDIDKHVGTSSKMSDNPPIAIDLEGYKETMEADSTEDLPPNAFCSRCIEKGKVCLKSCPRGKPKK